MKYREINNDLMELVEVDEFGLKYLMPDNEEARKLFTLMGKDFIRATKLQSIQELFHAEITRKAPLFKKRDII